MFKRKKHLIVPVHENRDEGVTPYFYASKELLEWWAYADDSIANFEKQYAKLMSGYLWKNRSKDFRRKVSDLRRRMKMLHKLLQQGRPVLTRFVDGSAPFAVKAMKRDSPESRPA